MYAQLSVGVDSWIVQAFVFEYWARGGDLESLRTLHQELTQRLADVGHRGKDSISDVDGLLTDISERSRIHNAGQSSVWNLPMASRQRLLTQWGENVDHRQLAAKITALSFELREIVLEISKIGQYKSRRIMQSQNIIGMTTTACAARWDLLNSLEIEILVCEEAGEVMEAHTLCTLLPSLQHAIFIGDPLQLRPEVNEQMLTLETTTGDHYRLDESLLERLMLPRDPQLSAVPASHLTMQRRMHPDISKIARITYPYLQDHDLTADRPMIHGLASRMFWWDHRFLELKSDDLKSHSNVHEVEMVAGLVEYLLRSGAYSQGDIAVLTPYSGQLVKLHQRLGTSCDIWLSDKDRNLLLSDELLALGIEGRVTKDKVSISDMLRLTSVDNFQGEEAKIVILTTVRSGGSAGFLKSLNRINVACSRAREGFYIIGNSYTLSQVPMWRSVIDVFEGRIGPAIMTCCNTHPEHQAPVRQPEDFGRIQECRAVCGEVLKCGHKCGEYCHPPSLHQRLVCQEPCRTVFRCGHGCTQKCYQNCGPCGFAIDNVVLTCGHVGHKLCSGEDSQCNLVIDTRRLDCGHDLIVRCGDESQAEGVCPQPCGMTLMCGHTCPGKCVDCFKKDRHMQCIQKCSLSKSCGHLCLTLCHQGKPCPENCPEPCTSRCEHGPCTRRCSDDCDPCVKPASAGCEHQAPTSSFCCLPDPGSSCSRPCNTGRSSPSYVSIPMLIATCSS